LRAGNKTEKLFTLNFDGRNSGSGKMYSR